MKQMFFITDHIIKIAPQDLVKLRKKKKKSHTKEIGIRAIINRRQAIISSTNFEKKNIEKVIDKVFEMAKVVPKNEYCGLANSYEIKNFKEKDLSNLLLTDNKNITMNYIKNKVLDLEQSALENKKIINSEGAEISVSRDKYILIGSNGFWTFSMKKQLAPLFLQF